MGRYQVHKSSREKVLRNQAGLRPIRKLIRLWSPDRHGHDRLMVLRERDGAGVVMKNIDPDFSVEGFERELREYIVPEVVDAYLSAEREALTQRHSVATL